MGRGHLPPAQPSQHHGHWPWCPPRASPSPVVLTLPLPRCDSQPHTAASPTLHQAGCMAWQLGEHGPGELTPWPKGPSDAWDPPAQGSKLVVLPFLSPVWDAVHRAEHPPTSHTPRPQPSWLCPPPHRQGPIPATPALLPLCPAEEPTSLWPSSQGLGQALRRPGLYSQLCPDTIGQVPSPAPCLSLPSGEMGTVLLTCFEVDGGKELGVHTRSGVLSTELAHAQFTTAQWAGAA